MNAVSIDTRPITVSVVNDYELVVRGVEAMLAGFDQRVVVVDTSAGGVPDADVDVALFDTTGARDISLRLREVLDSGSTRRLLLYSWDPARAWASAPADDRIVGFLSKTAPAAEVVDAIESAATSSPRTAPPKITTQHRGWIEPLSARESDVAILLSEGLTNREIADELGLSIETVKTYTQRLFDKLGARNRTHAAARIVHMGLSDGSGRLLRQAIPVAG